jgi:hypothetical protein
MTSKWTVKTTVFSSVYKWGFKFEREHWGLLGIRVNVVLPAFRVTIFGRSIVAGRLPETVATTTTSEE